MKAIVTIILFLSLQAVLYSANICNIESIDTLDFGRIAINSTIDDEIPVFNNWNSEIVIYNIKTISYFNDYLEFDNIDLPLRIQPNSGYNINVKFHAKQNVNFAGVVFVQVGCMESIFTLPIYVKATITLSKDGKSHITDNRWGSDLLDAIFLSMNNHTVFSYSNARQLFWGNFDKKDGLVECVYTGKTIDPGETPNFSTLDAAGFNTEHTWPKSKGAENEPPESDINHLFVADKTTNDKRANYPFGYVTTTTYENGGSKLGKDDGGNTVFEVREKSRGNIARAMFYFAVRYSNPNEFLNTQETILRQWAAQDPVDAYESARNDSVTKYQKKSNLFIECPNLLDRIPSISQRSDVDYQPIYTVSDTGIVFHLAFTPPDASVKFYIPNFNFNSENSSHTSYIENVTLSGNNPESFELIYDFENKQILPNSFRVVEIKSKAQSPASAVVTIDYQGGIQQSVNVTAKDPMMSVSDFATLDFQVYNYPSPAFNSTKIVFEGVESIGDIRSVKLYDLMLGEIADLSNDYSFDGNNVSYTFNRSSYSSSAQIYFARFELISGKSVIHPIIFTN